MHIAFAQRRIARRTAARRSCAALCPVVVTASVAQPPPQPQVLPQPAPPVAAVSVADAFRKLSGETSVSRSVSLADLGFAPIVLGYPDTSRDIALPVPPNVPLS